MTYLQNQQTRLMAEHVISEAINVMHNSGKYKLPIFDGELHVGTITFSEIFEFLNYEPEKYLIPHKLCFTMETLLKRISLPRSRSAAL